MEVKKLWKSKFLGYFSKAKTEECDQNNLSLSGKFGMLLSGLDTYFLEVSAHALLKVATKGSFRGKKSKNLAFLGYFSEVKRKECDQKDWSVCNRFFIIIPFSTTFFLEVGARVS